jgi:hypothetical protein
MIALCGADHLHFMDHVEQVHEMLRTAPMGGEMALIQNEMKPIARLTSGKCAHLFTRGLALAHLDAVLRQSERAREFLAGDIESELKARGVEAIVHR